jgi:SAM-dependent methyltransferase
MLTSKVLDPRRLLAIPELYRKFQTRVQAKNSFARLAHDFLKISPGQRVLDIGCGPADILAQLPLGIEYEGYDLEPGYIAAAKERHGDRGSFAVRAVSPEAADNIGTFDVVISMGVLHHLTDDDADALFASAVKVLRPGGRIVTLDGAYLKGQNPIARLLLALDRGRYVRTPAAYLRIAHRHFPDAQATILHDLIAIPYTHCIIEGRVPTA